MKRVIFLPSLIVMSMCFQLQAQDTQKEAENAAKTKMELFSSKTGVITKFIDTQLPNLSALYTSAETRIRKLKVETPKLIFTKLKKRANMVLQLLLLNIRICLK